MSSMTSGGRHALRSESPDGRGGRLSADESAAVAEAREAIAAFVGAVASAVDGLKAILAPEFQLLRATGVGYDREGYIESELPTDTWLVVAHANFATPR